MEGRTDKLTTCPNKVKVLIRFSFVFFFGASETHIKHVRGVKKPGGALVSFKKITCKLEATRTDEDCKVRVVVRSVVI